MAKQKGRKGQRNRSTRNAEAVFFLDGRNTVNKPRVVTGKVADFDLDYNEFTVIMHSGAKTTFSTADWDELVFGNKEKAQALANKLPKVGRVAYLLDKEKKEITFEVVAFYAIPYVYFRSGSSIRANEVNKTLFSQKTMAFTRLDLLKKEI